MKAAGSKGIRREKDGRWGGLEAEDMGVRIVMISNETRVSGRRWAYRRRVNRVAPGQYPSSSLPAYIHNKIRRLNIATATCLILLSRSLSPSRHLFPHSSTTLSSSPCFLPPSFSSQTPREYCALYKCWTISFLFIFFFFFYHLKCTGEGQIKIGIKK